MLNKLSFNLVNELNESETKSCKIKKKVIMESNCVKTEDCNVELNSLEEPKHETLNEGNSDAVDRLFSGNELYFRDADGTAIMIHYADNYPQPEEYDEGYKTELGGSEEALNAAQQAAENGDVWELVEVDNEGNFNGTIYGYAYGIDELKEYLKDLREVKVKKSLEEDMIDDNIEAARQDSIEKGLISEEDEDDEDDTDYRKQHSIIQSIYKQMIEDIDSREGYSRYSEIFGVGDSFNQDAWNERLKSVCKKLDLEDVNIPDDLQKSIIEYVRSFYISAVGNELNQYAKKIAKGVIKKLQKKPELIDGCFKPDGTVSTKGEMLFDTVSIVNLGYSLYKYPVSSKYAIMDKISEIVHKQINNIRSQNESEETDLDEPNEDDNKNILQAKKDELEARLGEILASIQDKQMDTDEFRALSREAAEIDSQITDIDNQLQGLYEEDCSKEIKENCNDKKIKKECDKPITEANVSGKTLLKNQGNIYMFECKGNKDFTHIVGENYNESENLLENVETYTSKEEADKDYLNRCGLTEGYTSKDLAKDGGKYKKIDLYVDGKYETSTNSYKTVKEAIAALKNKDKYKDKKITGEFSKQ